MSEEDLEELITLDDPGEDELGEDTFHSPQAKNTRQPFSNKERHDQQTDDSLQSKGVRGEEL